MSTTSNIIIILLRIRKRQPKVLSYHLLIQRIDRLLRPSRAVRSRDPARTFTLMGRHLALPDHHKDERGDEVDSKEAADEGQETLAYARPWAVADAEEYGVFAFDGVAVALAEKRGSLGGWHGCVCVVVSITSGHFVFW